nr:hypothetical protein [Tanacetum cinerariifolium]
MIIPVLLVGKANNTKPLGIKKEFSVPRTPEQNGVAERKNRTLIGNKLHKAFPLPVIEFDDSYKVPTNTDPDNSITRKNVEQSGRTVTITTEDMQRKKNDVKARTTLLLSLPDEHHLATEWLMHTIVWRNMNDLDTMSLNDLYNHLKVYEAEVQKKSNSNSQDMGFISSSKNNSNEYGNTACVTTASTAFPTGSVNVATISQDTASAYIASQSNDPDLSFQQNAEFQDCSENSSNEVTTASSTVPTVGQNSLNSTNTFSAAGPSNTAVSPIYGDASQFPDDPDMPGLEDIIYSDDEDVVGTEADFNNLESSIPVSPIPTTRIHKDHPVSQIIGDLSSTTQTRSITKAVKDQDPSWIEAMQEELLQFKMQKV